MERVKKYSTFLKESELENQASVDLTKDQIDFLETFCKQHWAYDASTGKVNVKGNFNASLAYISDLEGIEFGKVDGDFIISGNLIKSLQGCPETVGGNFNCSSNKNLKSLEFGPKYVGADYLCYECSLESLEGSPEEIKGTFNFSNNWVENLSGSPRKVKENFVGKLNFLESVEDSPDFVGGDFNLAQNNITFLRGCTNEILGDFHMNHNNLLDLEGGPIGHDKMVYGIQCNSGLKSIKGSPEKVFSFDASSCDLESIEGSPAIVLGDFLVDDNKIKSLKGSPDYIGGNFYCRDNEISDLTGISPKIKGGLSLENNPIESLEGIDYSSDSVIPKTIWMDIEDKGLGNALLKIHRACYVFNLPWKEGAMKAWEDMDEEERVKIYKCIKEYLPEEDLKFYRGLEKFGNLKNLL